jgi:hypothetical protein
VRHNDRNETYLCQLDKEAETLSDIVARSAVLGAKLTADGNRVRIDLRA